MSTPHTTIPPFVEEKVKALKRLYSPIDKNAHLDELRFTSAGLDAFFEEVTKIAQSAYEQGRREGEEAKNNAYHERNLLVQALTQLYPSYLARHDENDTLWEKDWMWIVYVEVPTRVKIVSGDQHNHVPQDKWFKNETKQVSWHIHDTERHLFDHLEVKENNWDGHTTEEKYRRLQALSPTNT